MWEKRRIHCHTVEDVIRENIWDRFHEKLEDYLTPKEAPYLKNLKEAVEFMKHTAEEGKILNIVADYDADGITSGTILTLLQWYLGGKTHTVFPKRMSEGYGFSEKILNRLVEGNIITIDNGIAAANPISKATQMGYECFVIDHHLKRDDGILPNCPILDPHIENESTFTDFCAAGLAWSCMREALGENRNESEEFLLEYATILASIATVTDVVPLHGANRQLLKDGMVLFQKEHMPIGLRLLKQKMDITVVGEDDYGFKIGPVFNAAGRMEDDGPSIVFRLLTTDDEVEAEQISELLLSINEERKQQVAEEVRLAKEMLGDERPNSIVLASKDFHQGTVGIVSGKLTEEYGVPSVVFAITADGLLHGSGRSVSDINLKGLMDKVHGEIPNIFLGYGGHAGAIGVTIHPNTQNILWEKMNELLPKREKSDVSFYDLEIRPEEVEEVLAELDEFRPFGEGNPMPIFLIKDVTCGLMRDGNHYRILGNQGEHVKTKMPLGDGDLPFNLFFLRDNYEKEEFPQNFDCLANLSYNYFRSDEGKPEVMVQAFQKKEEPKTELYQSLASLLDFSL